jgi:hypothetical protein
LIENDEVIIHVSKLSERSRDSPKITAFFSNGIQDELDLVPYGRIQRNLGNCNYLGRLHNDNESSVAVTGCLRKPGDIMELTILSQNSANKMFTVDFDGNTKTINFSQFRDQGKFRID